MTAFKLAATGVSHFLPPSAADHIADIRLLPAALHFKLAVANDNDGKGSSYEDTEFQYTPRLDANRDKDLLEILPDYLSEEITFSRLNAAKFYSRVVETLTRKRADDE